MNNMEPIDTKVYMHGTSMAILLNSLEKSESLEGLLVGDLVRRNQDIISDGNTVLVKKWNEVLVTDVLPLDENNVYRLEKSGVTWISEASEKLLNASHPGKQIVGFYCLKKCEMIGENLSPEDEANQTKIRITPNKKDLMLMEATKILFEDPYIYLIIGQSIRQSKATIKYTTAAYIASKPNNKPVRVEIPNLGMSEEIKYTSSLRGNTMIDNWPEQAALADAMLSVVEKFENVHLGVGERVEAMRKELEQAELEEEKVKDQLKALKSNETEQPPLKIARNTNHYSM